MTAEAFQQGSAGALLDRMAVRLFASSLESVFVFMVFIAFMGVRVRHRMMNVKPAVCALLAFRQGGTP